MQNNPLLLPAVTSFVPSLPAGAPFRISIHSWQNPEISRYVQLLNKPSDLIIFEARLFIDGRIVGHVRLAPLGVYINILEGPSGLTMTAHGLQSSSLALVRLETCRYSCPALESDLVILPLCDFPYSALLTFFRFKQTWRV